MVILLTMVVSCAAFAAGQSKNAGDETAYNDMVAKVKGGDLNVDFKALRIAFTKTKAYSPYGGGSDEIKAAFAAVDKKDYKAAIKAVDAMLKDDYVDMDAHVAASLAYGGMGDNAKADFHKKVYLGLVNSIITSGDGKTPETGYVVISTHEEYVTLRALGLGAGSQALQHLGDHTFDVLTATNPKTNDTLKIYFNIDISWKAETDMFK